MFRYVFYIYLSLTLTTAARAPKEFSLQRTEVVMQTEGIKFKPFRDMVADPIQPLRGRFYTRKSSGTVEKVQVYHKNELWRLDNFVSTYKNDLITVQIFRVNYLIPSGMKTYGKSYVEKSDFQKFTKPITPENEKDILNWLRFATGKKCQIEGKDLRLNYGFQTKAVLSEAKEGVYQFLAYSKDNRVYFIYLEMSGAEARDSERAVKEFMRYMKIEPPKEAKASKFQSSKFKPSGKVSPEYLNTIEEVKKQVLNSKGWWLAQTNNYVLKSNMPTKKRSFARKVQEHVEFIRTVYEKFIPPIDEINAVSIITIPNTKEEYFSYTGAPDWSAGVWMSSRKELAVSPYTTDEDRLMNVLRHEAFHQYIFYALNENRSPAWFNEGHADLFSAIKKSGSRVTLIEDNYHLRKLLPLFQRGRISIEKHINLGHSAFYADKDLNYPLAWSIIYYLRKAVPILKNKKEYTQILPRALEAIAANKNIQAVTKEAFKGIDMKLFQKDFLEFWASKSLRSRASRNYIVPRK